MSPSLLTANAWLRLVKGKEQSEILPVFWEDNYISLLPGQNRELTVRVRKTDFETVSPTLLVDGFNVVAGIANEDELVRLRDNPSLVEVETYPEQLEPENQDAVIWRFLDLPKLRDLIETSEIYFCRADLFADEREGLPPEDYLATFGLHPFDVNDRRELINHIGSVAQFREGFYVNCWYLFRGETCQMWKEHGTEGVAITSQYKRLKSALNAMSDRAY